MLKSRCDSNCLAACNVCIIGDIDILGNAIVIFGRVIIKAIRVQRSVCCERCMICGRILKFCTCCMYIVIQIFLCTCDAFTKCPPATVPKFSTTFNSTTIWIFVALILTKIAITLIFRIITKIFIFFVGIKMTVLKSTKVFLSCIKDLLSTLHNFTTLTINNHDFILKFTLNSSKITPFRLYVAICIF